MPIPLRMRPSSLPPLPPLPTRDTKPSWHNRAGRTDRSACTTIRAKDLFPPPPPHKVSRRSTPGRSAAQSRVTFLLHARHLARLHDRHRPQQHAGDLRTTKSNAMRNPHTARRDQSHKRLHDRDIALNPNRGATKSKFLGLWEDWSQRLTIVHRKSRRAPVAPAQFVCPMCDRRVRNLYLPMCTREEANDADLAEGWVNAVDAHFHALRKPMPADLLRSRAELVQRYGPLFHSDRELRCRHCWHIRYGESKSRAAP